jgi:hypothetical protein
MTTTAADIKATPDILRKTTYRIVLVKGRMVFVRDVTVTYAPAADA